MKNYVVKQNNKLYIVGPSNQVPENCIGVLPKSITKEDEKFLIATQELNKKTQLLEWKFSINKNMKAQDQSLQNLNKTARAWEDLRQERDRRLSACDWTQLSDSPLSSVDKVKWVNYRQELRDLPANTANPLNPTWPSQPS